MGKQYIKLITVGLIGVVLIAIVLPYVLLNSLEDDRSVVKNTSGKSVNTSEGELEKKELSDSKSSDEPLYLPPDEKALEKLKDRANEKFSGNIFDYVAAEDVVMVKSSEEEFEEFCESLFSDKPVDYEKDRNDIVTTARVGEEYLLIRTEFFTPVSLDSYENLRYEDIPIGDCEPGRYEFFYDSTGKYALVYFGNDKEDKVCRKFLGFE